MTIELHSNLLNSMAGKLSSLLGKLTGQDTTLKDLQSACKNISSDEIDLSDVVTNIQNSSDSQSEQKKKLQKLKEKVENFIDKAEQVDTDVKDLINRRKDEFYKAHYNLKPYSEMGFWEKRWDNLKKVGQWCKEHWKLVVVILVIAVLAIATVLTGGALSAALAAVLMGVLKGALGGALIGGFMSLVTGGSFLEGFENGAFAGAIMGGLGALGGVVSGWGTCAKMFTTINTISKMSGGITALMGGFDLLALGSGVFFPTNPLTTFNQNLHKSKLYNGFQLTVSAISVFTGGMVKGMKTNGTCFIAGTMIHTAAGLVAIESIKVGDKVLSTNEDTFERSHKTVLETYIRTVTTLVILTIAGEVIITTLDHPFYVKDKGFVNAAELQIGNELLDSNGKVLLIENYTVELTEELTTVYNFQVEDFHTYHVGENGVWVHNADCVISRSKHPDAAKHIEDAIDDGHPSKLTIDRNGAKMNRKASLKGIDKVPGKQLDEFPPAMFKEAGKGASVRPISPHDNMGAGSSMGRQLHKYPDGTEVHFIITD